MCLPGLVALAGGRLLAFLAAAAAVNCLTQLPHSLYLAHAHSALVFWVTLFNSVLYFTVTSILTGTVSVFFPATVIFCDLARNISDRLVRHALKSVADSPPTEHYLVCTVAIGGAHACLRNPAQLCRIRCGNATRLIHSDSPHS
jgi:hypothetical protein